MATLQVVALWVCITSIQCSSHCSRADGTACGNESGDKLYEDPFLARRQPGEVGDVVEEDMKDGTTQTVITRAINPPIFELPNCLSDEECDYIRETATAKGMNEATVLLNKGVKTKKPLRQSKANFLPAKNDKILTAIKDRASILTGLSKKFIYDSEDFQVGYYGVGGYYNFHHDSTKISKKAVGHFPCCHQHTQTNDSSECRLCRYITILFYLNDVEEGGETAFPLADKPGHSIPDKFEFFDLLCENAPVVASPVKGNAVMWYNNVVDDEHGWLGVVDILSLHGGCPVTRGEKWVSNLWITAPQYNSLHKPSIYV